MRELGRQWPRFWFAPAPPTNLGLCRVLFFGALFLFYLPQDFSAWGELSDVFWRPIWLFRRLHFTALSPEWLAFLQTVWKGALALSCLGLFTRLSTVIAFLLSVYLLGLPHNFGKIDHYDTLLVFILGVMALSLCGDACSVDRLLANRRSPGGAASGRPAPCGEYTWPIRATWLVMAFIFFAAGVAKLQASGLEWIFSDTLAIYLIQSSYHTRNADPLTSWGLYVAQHEWLCRLLAAATIVVETGFPLALVCRWARWIWVPGMLGLLIGIRLLMGPTFEPYMIAFLFWVPWDRLVHWLRDVPRQRRSRDAGAETAGHPVSPIAG
jgi:hypothetical protein